MSPKLAIYILGKLCFVIGVYFADQVAQQVTWLYSNVYKAQPSQKLSMQEEGSAEKQAKALASYSIVTKRNIFGEEPKEASAEDSASNVPKTNLKLRLVGTNISSTGDPFAILEEKGKKEQDVFELGDTIFGQAELVEVLAESVRIKEGGQIKTLELEEGLKSAGATSGGDDASEFEISEEELGDALANLPKLLSQARAVPYFRNGKSIGMRLFAIRRGSLYEKLGLKNGDIILAVNDNSVSDPTQALKLFEQLKSERSIGVKVERNGQSKDLSYGIR